MRQLALEFFPRRERFVKHGHYNNGWSIICPIPLLARTIHRDRHTLTHTHRWKEEICRCVCLCEGEGEMWEAEGMGGKEDMKDRGILETESDRHEWERLYVCASVCVCACARRTLLHNGKTTWQGARIAVLQTRQFNKDCILGSAALNWKRRVIDCLGVSSCLLRSWVCCVQLTCVAKCPSPLTSVVKLLAFAFCFTRSCGCFIKHRVEGAICKTWTGS